jgi:hypothetical protein
VVFTASVITAVVFYNTREDIQNPPGSPGSKEQPGEILLVPSDSIRQAGKSTIASTTITEKNNTAEQIPLESDRNIIGPEVENVKNKISATTPAEFNRVPGADVGSGSLATRKLFSGGLLPRKFNFFPAEPLYFAASERNVSGMERLRDDYYRERKKFDISLGVSYGWMQFNEVHPENMVLPESVPSLGLDLLFEKDRYYLKTGLGYTSWEESADYKFQYNKHEVVYEYQYVDSASYIPATNQITYFTTEQQVYDSVFYQKPDVVRNQYRVLQIPLIFGYKLLETKKWMIGLNVGIGADFNISSTKFTPLFDESQSSLVGVENHMIYRPTINWRMMAGAGLFYRLSNRISLYLEPGFDIYLNTVYPGTDLKNVSYYEIKFGILYRF